MPRRRRQRASLPRLLLRGAFALAGLWLAGFVVFLISVFTAAPPNPLPPADGIVALTGGDNRIGAALALLAERQAPLLLISGAGRGTYLGDFTADDAAAITRYASAITLGHMADTTHGNALEAAAWARAHNMRSLIVVTADYHMPRAMQEISQQLPGVTLIPDPVRPPAMRKMISLPTLRLLIAEYTKYLTVRAGLGRLAAGLLNSEP
ncbi:YdcF family protein [Acidocella sp. KAb 2-4]|uniref:YdcF family protein n=1 Tax=Acidocella sp. KAb 2-4 TaxID=2885158 RepID=UPI001D0832B6|nr:YdcF family protein [Acidocella sp. KAb 2-4]MCB5945457.1 YdcF family protein [Acidocella sp. KAb 2-4]